MSARCVLVRKDRSGGFSLIELTVAIGIMAIILGVVVFRLASGGLRRAEVKVGPAINRRIRPCAPIHGRGTARSGSATRPRKKLASPASSKIRMSLSCIRLAGTSGSSRKP